MHAARRPIHAHAALVAALGAALIAARAGAAEAPATPPIAVAEDSAKWESGYGARFYQVVGTVVNRGAAPVGAVKLRVDLLDDGGKTVAQGTCWNGAAESLADAADGDARKAIAAGKVKPLAPGASDRFRCTFLDEDVPKFSRHTTSLAAVIPAP